MAMVTRKGGHASCSRRWCGLLIVWALVGALPSGRLSAVALTEYEVKAGFLYHFGWFVEWPDLEASGREEPFIIGVLGANPFGTMLDDIMHGKTIHDRPVVVKYYQREEEASASHILFISAPEAWRLPTILKILEGKHVLTVSDMARFNELGGMIALRVVGQKVHFDINMDAAERQQLKLSSQLLKLAKVIYSTQHKGN
jgi:hypothetical protein